MSSVEKRFGSLSVETILHAPLLGWSAWPLSLTQGAQAGDDPAPLSAEGLALDFIPAGLRRRCSSFSKVTLAVAHAAASRASKHSNLATVFASAHGESTITANLLREIAANQPLSPMGFSLSVHNAASGLYSIATHNTAPATALAAGPHTFVMGLCEAFLLLRETPTPGVLYVFSDDLVPEIFLGGSSTPQTTPYALAMLLGPWQAPATARLTLSLSPQPAPLESVTPPAAPAFAHWLLTDSESERITLRNDSLRWSCGCAGAAGPLYTSPLQGS